MKKMRFSFYLVVLFLFSGGVADAVDWTGIWVTSSGNEITISQNGQQLNAVATKLGSRASQYYGWKLGDQAFYGTLNGQTMTGKLHGHFSIFPINYQALCPEQWDYYSDLLLTLSSDGNTIQGQYFYATIGTDCTVIIDTELTAISYTRKIEGDVTGDYRVDLSDAILALRIVAGISVTDKINLYAAEVNGDEKIGIEEVVYVLQKVAGLRP